MGHPDFVSKKIAKRRCVGAWSNVVIDPVTLRVAVATAPANSTARSGEVLPLIQYPTAGNPLNLGEPEGKVRDDPGITSAAFDPNGKSKVVARRFIASIDPVVEMLLIWSGDEAIYKLLSPYGPWTSVDSYGGGGTTLRETNLLLIYADDQRPRHGYIDDRPPVFLHKLFWKGAVDPIATESEGLPEKFPFVYHPLEGRHPATGDCFAEGMRLFHRYFLNLHGELVNEDGEAMTITPNDFPVLLSMSGAMGF